MNVIGNIIGEKKSKSLSKSFNDRELIGKLKQSKSQAKGSMHNLMPHAGVPKSFTNPAPNNFSNISYSMTKYKMSSMSPHKASFSFGNLTRDTHSRNDATATPIAPLTHSQAQSLLPEVGRRLARGIDIDTPTLQQIAPYIQIGAKQQKAIQGGLIDLRLSKGTGYIGPDDPSAQPLYTQYTRSGGSSSSSGKDTTDSSFISVPTGETAYTTYLYGKPTVTGTSSGSSSGSSRLTQTIPSTKTPVATSTTTYNTTTKKTTTTPSSIAAPVITSFTTPKSTYVTPNTTSNIPKTTTTAIVSTPVKTTSYSVISAAPKTTTTTSKPTTVASTVTNIYKALKSIFK